ncbi:MAG: hypothetical protein ACKO58_02815 [Cyanobium sp.]
MTLTHSDASELAQLMEGTTAGALIPEIVRRGFQDLLEAGVTAAVGAQLHAIPKLRQGSFFTTGLNPAAGSTGLSTPW